MTLSRQTFRKEQGKRRNSHTKKVQRGFGDCSSSARKQPDPGEGRRVPTPSSPPLLTPRELLGTWPDHEGRRLVDSQNLELLYVSRI
jgi:hypothetical protein